MLCQLGAGKLKDDGARYVYILPRSQVGAQGHSEPDFLVRSTRQGRTCPKTERIQRPAVKQEVGSEALQPISKADCKPSAVALDEERSPRNDLLVVKSMMGTMHKVRNHSSQLTLTTHKGHVDVGIIRITCGALSPSRRSRHQPLPDPVLFTRPEGVRSRSGRAQTCPNLGFLLTISLMLENIYRLT